MQHLSNWLMTTLKPHPKKEDVYQVTVNFSGYSSLITTVSDLMKLCTVAMLSDEPHISPVVNSNRIDMAGIMELALQLMPYGEAEFLDEMRNELFVNAADDIEYEYNYSTIHILEEVTT